MYPCAYIEILSPEANNEYLMLFVEKWGQKVVMWGACWLVWLGIIYLTIFFTNLYWQMVLLNIEYQCV